MKFDFLGQFDILLQKMPRRVAGLKYKMLHGKCEIEMKKLLFFLAFVALTGFAVAGQKAKPNVVLIFIDDLGFGDTGPYGCTDIPTPNIDKLAENGVKCTSVYVTNPPCCPSRCSMMMGQYAQRFGKYGMSRGLPIPKDRPTLARFMRDNGYVTGQIGKWDIGTKQQRPMTTGFTEVAKVAPRKTYNDKELAVLPKNTQKKLKKKKNRSKYFCVLEDGTDAWVTDYDGDMMVDFIKRNKDKSFFLYWSPEAVHSFNDETPERLMSRTTAKGKRRELAGAIVSVDDQVGKVLKALEKYDLKENTLVIFSSDNGPNLTEKGSAAPYTGGKGQGTQKEGWVRVPTIYSFPGKLPKGKTYHGLNATFDYYSTIASLIGKPVPKHCDGVDLFPYLRGEKKGNAHEYLFWLNNDPDDPKHRHLVAVRWKDWRLYKHELSDTWQLFNLKLDPKEENNVAPKHPDIVKSMAAKHEKWAKTLPPLAKIPANQKNQPQVPQGHGWFINQNK